MTDLKTPPPAVLFVALLYPPIDPETCMQGLSRLFGPAAHLSPTYAMSAFSSYYEKEMGSGLQKQFVSFTRLVPMDRLAGCKLAAQQLERELQPGPGRRNFNIDPGLVTGYSVILSTSKNHAHRIYLQGGVFAEVTLIFREKRFHPLPWTYPDYQSPLALKFFESVRPRTADRNSDWD